MRRMIVFSNSPGSHIPLLKILSSDINTSVWFWKVCFQCQPETLEMDPVAGSKVFSSARSSLFVECSLFGETQTWQAVLAVASSLCYSGAVSAQWRCHSKICFSVEMRLIFEVQELWPITPLTFRVSGRWRCCKNSLNAWRCLLNLFYLWEMCLLKLFFELDVNRRHTWEIHRAILFWPSKNQLFKHTLGWETVSFDAFVAFSVGDWWSRRIGLSFIFFTRGADFAKKKTWIAKSLKPYLGWSQTTARTLFCWMEKVKNWSSAWSRVFLFSLFLFKVLCCLFALSVSFWIWFHGLFLFSLFREECSKPFR